MKFPVLTSILVVAGIVAPDGKAQLTISNNYVVNARYGYNGAHSSQVDYLAYILQSWAGPLSDRATSVDVSSSIAGMTTLPISNDYRPTPPSSPYVGWTLGWGLPDWSGFSANFEIDEGSTAPSSFSISTLYHGGAIDTTSITTTFDTAFLPALPEFSADTLDLLSAPVDNSFTVHFNPAVLPLGATNIQRFLQLDSVTTEGLKNLLYYTVDSSATSMDIDLSSLSSNGNYVFTVGDEWATDSLTYIADSAIFFSVVPEPSTYGAIGLLVLGIAISSRQFAGRKKTKDQ